MSNFSVTTIGGIDAWAGKTFINGDLDATSVGISVNATEPGDESPFWHAHARSEEIYIVLDGVGEIAIDDEIVPLSAGTAVRVGVGAHHALRCLPDSPVALKWLCLRSGSDSLEGIGKDGTRDADRPYPWNE